MILLCNSSTEKKKKKMVLVNISSPFIRLLKAFWMLLFAQPGNDNMFPLHNLQHLRASSLSPKAFESQDVLLLLFTHSSEALQVPGPDFNRSLA